jgi:hypothetical protein
MKSITIVASEEDIWNWKACAIRERKRFGEWIRGRLNAQRGAIKPDKPEIQEPARPKDLESQIKPEIRKGVEVPMSVPANTVDEAKERLSQISKRMPTGESDAEFLKRQEKATKEMEKRYGKI